MSDERERYYDNRCGNCEHYEYAGYETKGYCDKYGNYCWPDDSCSSYSSRSSSGGGCYLTTACMESMSNFHDNCSELTTLRSFRDSYVEEKYPEEIQKYYQDAPKIVQQIDKDVRRQEIYRLLYQEYVLSSVRLIKENHLDAAYRTYKKMVSSLTEKYLV